MARAELFQWSTLQGGDWVPSCNYVFLQEHRASRNALGGHAMIDAKGSSLTIPVRLTWITRRRGSEFESYVFVVLAHMDPGAVGIKPRSGLGVGFDNNVTEKPRLTLLGSFW